MSRLGEALVERNNAKMRYDEAKHELMEAMLEVIANSPNGVTARDLSSEAEVPTCAIMGSVQSAMRRRIIRGDNERQSVEYVRLNRDGTINMNDRIVHTYFANRYTLNGER